MSQVERYIGFPEDRQTLLIINVEDHRLCFSRSEGIAHILHSKKNAGPWADDGVPIEIRYRYFIELQLDLWLCKESKCTASDLDTHSDLSARGSKEQYLWFLWIGVLSDHSDVVVRRDVVSSWDDEGVVS